MSAAKIESLELSLRGFQTSEPRSEKELEFKERQIREIEKELKELTGGKSEDETAH